MPIGNKRGSPKTYLYNSKAELNDWKLPGWRHRNSSITAKKPQTGIGYPLTSSCTIASPVLHSEKWSATNSISPRRWKISKGSLDIYDKLMVRVEKGCRMGRQASLDSPQRPILRRQISEDLKAPGPLKIAWTSEQNDQPSVEVIAKKCGQPKPSTVKPPRSPFMPDQSAAVVYSRQQLTERLRTSWKKSSGRHNLNIFLNQSVESETDSVSEVADSPGTRTPSISDDDGDEEERVPDPTPEPTSRECDKGGTACASDRRQAFRMMGRQSKILDTPCSTPEPSKVSVPPMRRMMSAPTHQSAKKLTKAASVESRIKSAPSKRKHKPQTVQRRRTKGDSSDDEKGANRRVKRGVEKGEIVTMVSLVSPAESEDDEPIPPPVTPKLPPTPKPPQEVTRPSPPPPPPILSLRKPVKAVSFRPAGPPQPSSTQYQTSFPLKRTLAHQNTSGTIGIASSNSTNHPPLQRQLTQIQSSPPSGINPVQYARPSTAPCSSSQTNSKSSETGKEPQSNSKIDPSSNAREQSNVSHDGIRGSINQKTLQRKPSMTNYQPPSIVRRKVIQATNTVIKLEPEPVKMLELSVPPALDTRLEEDNMNGEHDSATKPIFKNTKEKECWELFKKMSDRGVTVSFETVLRGLLTPTEYRMRRSALLSVC